MVRATLSVTLAKSKAPREQRQDSARERDTMDLKKMFANHASKEQLKSRLHKELLQLNSKKRLRTIFKWSKDLNSNFFKG